MSVLHINYDPPMTRRLMEKKYFRANRFHVVDVGIRGGQDTCWQILGNQIHIFGFDPDEDECARLNEILGDRLTAFPYALGREAGERTFTFCDNFPSSSSLFGYNRKLTSRLIVGEKFEGPQSVRSVKVKRLDQVLTDHGIGYVDFLKMDAEGSEMDILQGAESLLNNEELLGVLTEVRFHPAYFQRGKGQTPPVFSDLDAYLRDHGFYLYDLDLYRFGRRSLPLPFLYDFIGRNQKPYPGPSISGQVMGGDALYFRDQVGTRQDGKALFLDTRSLTKLACLFEIFGLNDCAAELIIEFDNEFRRDHDCANLLDMLTPEVKGKRVNHAAHMDSYRNDPGRFRPAYGRRFPEYIVTQYDGTFIPPWGLGQRWANHLKRLIPQRIKNILRKRVQRPC